MAEPTIDDEDKGISIDFSARHLGRLYEPADVTFDAIAIEFAEAVQSVVPEAGGSDFSISVAMTIPLTPERSSSSFRVQAEPIQDSELTCWASEEQRGDMFFCVRVALPTTFAGLLGKDVVQRIRERLETCLHTIASWPTMQV